MKPNFLYFASLKAMMLSTSDVFLAISRESAVVLLDMDDE
jgi:hypothetical protein